MPSTTGTKGQLAVTEGGCVTKRKSLRVYRPDADYEQKYARLTQGVHDL